MNHPSRMKERCKAVRHLRTIARAMVNDIARKMSVPDVLLQGDIDRDKVYNLYESEVECISKGKVHKKCKFGNKSGDTAGRNMSEGLRSASYHPERRGRVTTRRGKPGKNSAGVPGSNR